MVVSVTYIIRPSFTPFITAEHMRETSKNTFDVWRIGDSLFYIFLYLLLAS